MWLPSALLLFAGCVHCSFYDNPDLDPIPETGTPLDELKKKWDTDWSFSGVSTFAHLRHVKCLTTPYEQFDIGIIGAPFDTAVSYRTGARFGPRAIRHASARQTPYRSFNHRAGVNPYLSWPAVLDCGDIPITPFDNALALHQMSAAYLELNSRRALSYTNPPSHKHPKLVTLGGDHSVALPALRALYRTYQQPIALLHFDAHLDTWHPAAYPSVWSDHPGSQDDFTHGTMFWIASEEGLIRNTSSVHAGLRTRLGGSDYADYANDDTQGFLRIEADDIDELKPSGIADLIVNKIGTEVPVYLSLDIDVLDPGLAPGTGTPEPGGWTTRELIQILRGIEDLNLVGADVVEVSPAYDGRGEETALAAAQAVYEIVTSMVKRGLKERGEHSKFVKNAPGREWLNSGLNGKGRKVFEEVKASVEESVEEESVDNGEKVVEENVTEENVTEENVVEENVVEEDVVEEDVVEENVDSQEDAVSEETAGQENEVGEESVGEETGGEDSVDEEGGVSEKSEKDEESKESEKDEESKESEKGEKDEESKESEKGEKGEKDEESEESEKGEKTEETSAEGADVVDDEEVKKESVVEKEAVGKDSVVGKEPVAKDEL